MIIPHRSLESDTLQAILQEIVTRDGTDYGTKELDTEIKVAQLRDALNLGSACLVFDAESESCSILPADQAKALFGSDA